MRIFALFALTFMSTPAASSPREELSPGGQAIYDAYFSGNFVRGQVQGVLEERRDLNREIREALAGPTPDLETIRGLVAKDQALKVQAQQDAFEQTSGLLDQLNPADQVIYLRSMYPQISYPIIATPERGPSKGQAN